MSQKERPAKKKFRWSTLILILLLIAGIGFLAYPTVANFINQQHQSRAIANYSEVVAGMDPEKKAKMLEEAKEFNDSLREYDGVRSLSAVELTKYNSLLNPTNNGIMGRIEIPSLKVKLNVYHGTADSVLQIGVGHLAGTSLPIGGKGTHAVLSGHRGLPSATLFTHLDRMKEGDIFKLKVLDETLTYEVDQILVIEPSNMEPFKIDPEQDYCTLMTCTPYGINTHRLLVRGHRIPNSAEDSGFLDAAHLNLIILIIVVMLLSATWRWHVIRKRNKTRAQNQTEMKP